MDIVIRKSNLVDYMPFQQNGERKRLLCVQKNRNI